MANPGFGARHRGRIEGARRYQTVVMEYAPKADNMARKMEEKAKEMPEEGQEPATMSVTAAAKGSRFLQNMEIIVQKADGQPRFAHGIKNTRPKGSFGGYFLCRNFLMRLHRAVGFPFPALGGA